MIASVATFDSPPLADHTTFGVGGRPGMFASPTDVRGLVDTVAAAQAQQLDLRMLGRGSNVLVSDAGVRACVISLRKFALHIEQSSDGALYAGAGAPLPSLAMAAAKRGVSGFEFLIGIPGTVGGGIAMNAGIGGPHGRCIRDVLVAVDLLDPSTLTTSRRRAADLRLGYRTSRVLQEGLIVLGAVFALDPVASAADPIATQRKLKVSRAHRQPLGLSTCGSVFKQPEGGRAAGWYIEKADLKGTRIGGAHISQKHANWIVNDRGASGRDIAALMTLAHDRVLDSFGVTLEPEVVRWGFEGDLQP